MKHHAELKGKTLLFLFFLWYLWFGNLTIRAIFSPLLPLIEDEFTISHAKAAGIFTFTAIGYALSVSFAGVYGGGFGYKRSILISFAISTVRFVQCALRESVFPLLCRCFLHGRCGRHLSPLHDTSHHRIYRRKKLGQIDSDP